MITAEGLCSGRNNNFNLIRMIAASTVIVSHSFALAVGIGSWEPLGDWPFGLGALAVQVFFAISGFFILKSFDQAPSVASFFVARAARIAPALLVVAALTSGMLRLGVDFGGNPYPHMVNGSLWTIWYEVACYIGLALAGVCGFYSEHRFRSFLLGYAIVYVAIQSELIPINPAYGFLSFPFVFGMAVYHFRSRVQLRLGVAAGLLILALALQIQCVWSVALGYSAFYIGGAIPEWRLYNRLGDYSYGTYIYGWPIQQLLALFLAGISPFGMMALALPIAWGMGVLSWHFVEKPAMRLARNGILSNHRLPKTALAR